MSLYCNNQKKVLFELDISRDNKSCIKYIYSIRITRNTILNNSIAKTLYATREDFSQFPTRMNFFDNIIANSEENNFLLSESYTLDDEPKHFNVHFFDDNKPSNLLDFIYILKLTGISYSTANFNTNLNLLKTCTPLRISLDSRMQREKYYLEDLIVGMKIYEKSNPNKDQKYLRNIGSLFSLHNHGVKYNIEGLFSVTPELIAVYQAMKIRKTLKQLYPWKKSFKILDACSGLGGNSIQFALKGFNVLAIDNNQEMIEFSKNNAEVYGVSDYIEYVLDDVFDWAEKTLAENRKNMNNEPCFDAVFCSPPWGGPSYSNSKVYNLNSMFGDFNKLKRLANLSNQLSNGTFAFYLPRTSEFFQVFDLVSTMSDCLYKDPVPDLKAELEFNYINSSLKSLTLYCGHLANFEITQPGCFIK